MEKKSKLDKEKITKKWAPILEDMDVSEDKKGWLSEYAEIHQINENNMNIDGGLQPPSDDDETNDISYGFPTLLPTVMKVAAKTIGQDLVYVKPMDSIPTEDLERIITRIKQENRQEKIDYILDEREFIENELENDKEYQELCEKYNPKGTLMYLDYKYGSNKNDDDEE